MFRHPLGVQPWGNFFLSPASLTRSEGLGDLGQLSDAFLLKVLDVLDPRSVARVAAASRVLRCFASHEDLWKKHVLEVRHLRLRLPSGRRQERRGAFEFRGTWRETYAWGKNREPWFCARVSISAAWLQRENVPRCRGLSLQSFREKFEWPNLPVVLCGEMDDWPGVALWNRDYLGRCIGEEQVIVGNYEMSFQNYLKYCDRQREEMPLYLFDKHVLDACTQLSADFTVPQYFREDLFSLLSHRPDHRWLIMGPERSGSSFHKDPNSTSAWNAVVSGSKKWILFPPSVLPPGVHESPDGSQVATSISIMEWFLNFYDTTVKNEVQRLECVVRAGEVLFVPRGWWHMALNLEETIAVTQNFVSHINLPHVLRFLETKRETLVSGIPIEQRGQLYDVFVTALREKCPEVLDRALENKVGQKRSRLTALFSEERTVQQPDGGAFEFGFF